MRNALGTVPKLAQQMVAATLRTIFVQPDDLAAHDAAERVCRLFEKRYPPWSPAASKGPHRALPVGGRTNGPVDRHAGRPSFGLLRTGHEQEG